MIQKFTKHINQKFPFLKDKKLLIAISGGLDSVVLQHLLSTLNFNISLAHCNFNLRNKESDLDEEFVKNLSQKSSNQIFIKSFETENYSKKHKISTQIAARELRYSWFQELIHQHHFDFVLTAHHADDNLETFLINLTRGSGLEGFTGIPEINGNIIRPLLPFSRDEIQKYALKNAIEWREDASNASTKYVRNKIRHQIVPILKEINPSFLESFAKTTHYLQDSQQIVTDKIDEVSKKVMIHNASNSKGELNILIDEVKKLSNPKAYLYQLLKDYHFTEWNDVYNLLSAQSGKQVFSKTHVILKDRNHLILKNISDVEIVKNEETIEISENTSTLKNPIFITFKKVQEITKNNKKVIYVDKKSLTFPLKLRKWQQGDFFYPKGMNGKKKLSKYFKDEKISVFEKQNIWLLCNAKNEIIWIVNYRQDARFATSTKTTETLEIEAK